MKQSVFSLSNMMVKRVIPTLLFMWLAWPALTLPFKIIDSQVSSLNSDDILCIHQDRMGFLWFGTNYGLYRFDGVEFRMYEYMPDDLESISGNFIFDIIEDRDGTLWFCTNNGFDRYDRSTDAFVRIPILNGNGNIPALSTQHHINKGIVTSDGSLLVNVASNGIYIFNALTSTLEPVKTLSGKVITDASDIEEDKEGQLWIGTKTDGLICVSTDRKTLKHYRNGTGHSTINSNNVFSVHVDPLNHIWVGTDKGINHMIPGTNSFQYVNVPMPNVMTNSRMQQVYCITSDPENNVWFGTNGVGMHVLLRHRMQFVNYSMASGHNLSSDNIRSIYHDNQGNLWVGTSLGGINYVLNNNALVFKGIGPKTATKPGLSHGSVTSIAENETGELWIGTDGGGLNLYNPASGTTKKVLEGLLSCVLAIYPDKFGNLWLGGYLEGLRYYNPENNSLVTYGASYNDQSGLTHDDVRSIIEDSNGQLWVATNGGGLHLYNPETNRFSRFSHDPTDPNSLVSDHSIALYEDSAGNLFIGTYNGFSILNNSRDRFTNYQADNSHGSVSGNWIYAFCEDNKGRIWVGTNYGLNLLDRETGQFVAFTRQNGLAGNEVYTILLGDDNHLWLGTNMGLSRFNITDQTFINYDLGDGITGNRFNNGAALSNEKGTLFFGSNNGLTWFNPSQIKINPDKPPVYITNFLLAQSGRTIVPYKSDDMGKQEQKIRIPFREASVIVLSYAALNLINSEKCQYKYILDGFDTDWRNPGSQREATYTNLKPGNYTFRVIASNNDGIWNTEGAVVYFRITPPLYRSTMAYVFYFLTAITLLYFFTQFALIKIRHRRQLAIEQFKLKKTEELARLKNDFFISVSHELSTPLTLILTPLQRVLEKGETAHRKLIETAVTNAGSMLRMVNELLDFQRTDSGKIELLPTGNEIVSFIGSVVTSFKETYSEKNISLSFHPLIQSAEMLFDTEKMQKILSNLLSNAYKYTPAGGWVSVSVNVTDVELMGTPVGDSGYCEIVVSDNGVGISEEDLPHLFEKYYRAKPGSRANSLTQTMGYGIGLFVTKNLVELHEGQIDVVSSPGKGTEFRVRIPLKKPMETSEIVVPVDDYLIDESIVSELVHASACDLNENEKEKQMMPLLLLIDDNVQIIDLLKEILSAKYRILTACNGEKGYEAACRHSPDLIITDVMMPGIDGVQLCERIKSDFYTCHIPVILLTALNDNYFRLRGYQNGADDYISKPFNPRILETRVQNIIASRRMLQKKFISDLQVKPVEVTSVSSDEIFLENAIKAVENKIDNPDFSVVELAAEMNMSKATLYRKVTGITSQNPSQFIRTIRLKKAAYLLKTSDYNVSEVVYMVGLNDIKHFRKSFQKLFGKNPTEFKTQAPEAIDA
jgi:signal transduction histidine kinase/ligand-binding sensor domain-containing protein/DNA-binding response OmpR family regulator